LERYKWCKGFKKKKRLNTLEEILRPEKKQPSLVCWTSLEEFA
jgi:hypothetical protein